ncbi:MAG: AraC family transcriptional regulator [Thermoanaerobaculia bacterium]
MDAFRDRAQDALGKAAAPTRERIREDLATTDLPAPLGDFLRYLAEHLFDSQLTVDKARIEVGIGNNAVSTRFGHYFGVTAAKYIERRRIETAERMLRSSDVEIARVGRTVGFTSRSTFYAAYERCTGEKPGDVRRRPPAPEIDYRTWRKGIRGELTPDEARRVLDAFGQRYPELVRQTDPSSSPRTVVDGNFFERCEAERIWETVRERPFEEQQGIVRGYLFHSTALFDLLREKSREEGRQDRRRGVRLARLALISLERHEEILGERIHDLRALGWAWLANARRLALDFEGAEADFARADAEWSFPRARKDLRISAEICALKGSLRMFQRRYDEALDLLGSALSLSREVEDKGLEARVLVQRGAVHGYAERLAESVADLESAASLTADLVDPYMTFVVSGNLTNIQARAGNPEAATASLSRAKAHWKTLGHPLGWYQLRHLEGIIFDRLGKLRSAESCHAEALRGFSDLGEDRLAALVALDQAILNFKLDNRNRAMELASSILPVLESMKLHPETLAAVRLLAQEVAAMELSQDLLYKVRQLIRREPLLQLI